MRGPVPARSSKPSALATASRIIPPSFPAASNSALPSPAPLPRTPDLVFADEPTGNLDAATGHGIIDLLFARRAEMGATLIIVTHDANWRHAASGLSRWPTGVSPATGRREPATPLVHRLAHRPPRPLRALPGPQAAAGLPVPRHRRAGGNRDADRLDRARAGIARQHDPRRRYRGGSLAARRDP